MSIVLGILIVTRNRREQLSKLLGSISEASDHPKDIIIVSSGDEVNSALAIFEGKLNIDHYHLDKGGQIRQKIFGIKKIPHQVEWVAIFDDDLLVEKDSFRRASEIINEVNTDDLLGVGFSLPSTSKEIGTLVSRLLKTIFCLQGKFGIIKRNGHAVSYLESRNLIETKWLNGASLWRREILNSYQSEFLQAKYSAYEDVIFSYRASKAGKLLYAPECKLFFQDLQPGDVSNYEAFHSASYWRFYFVRSNSELSVLGLLWSQIGRSLDFTYRTSGGLRESIKAFTSTVSIFFDLVFFTIFRTEPLKVLKLRLKRTD